MAYDPKDPKQNWLPDYVRGVANMFGLKDWDIRIESESPESDTSIASIYRPYGQKRVRIRFGDMFWNHSREDQRDTVVHELIHCHMAECDRWAEINMKAPIYEAWSLMHEYAVDGLAAGVAPFMPLPPKPKP